MNFADIMKMLSNPQIMQARMNEIRERSAAIQATGSAGGGMVRVTLNGSLEMLSCEFEPEVIDPADREILQDLVRAAYNDASTRVREELQKSLASDMEGLPPGMFGGLG